MNEIQKKNLETVKEYFHKVGSQDFSLIELFSENVQIYFPKFGIGNGLKDLQQFASVFGGTFDSVRHHLDEFHYIISGIVSLLRAQKVEP